MGNEGTTNGRRVMTRSSTRAGRGSGLAGVAARRSVHPFPGSAESKKRVSKVNIPKKVIKGRLYNPETPLDRDLMPECGIMTLMWQSTFMDAPDLFKHVL